MQLNIVIIFVAITFISPALALSNNIGSQMSKTADNSAMIPGVVSTLHGQRAKTYWFHEDETADTSSLKRKKLHPSHLLHPLKFLGNLSHKLSSTFMPLGYPTRTPPGYLSYCIFSWIQDLSTNLRSVVATQRVLEGIGVGRDGATALSASLNFIARDGAGMASSLLFSSLASSRFHSDIKRWRLFADLIVDVGITLEVAATLVPASLFLPMICLGNICKAMCGVAAGACEGAINLHWAQGSDISDVNAKFGAQRTVTGGLGLTFAALFARSVASGSQRLVWILYFILTAIHILANVECMRLIAFDTLNTSRLDLLISDWMQQISSKINGQAFNVDSPKAVSKRERLFFMPNGLFKSSPKIPVTLGLSFNDFVKRIEMSPTKVQAIIANGQTRGYMVGVEHKRRRPTALLVSTFAGANIGKAYFEAWILSDLLCQGKHGQAISMDDAYAHAAEMADLMWPIFTDAAIRAGWNVKSFNLWRQGYEIEILKTN